MLNFVAIRKGINTTPGISEIITYAIPAFCQKDSFLAWKCPFLPKKTEQSLNWKSA